MFTPCNIRECSLSIKNQSYNCKIIHSSITDNVSFKGGAWLPAARPQDVKYFLLKP